MRVDARSATAQEKTCPMLSHHRAGDKKQEGDKKKGETKKRERQKKGNGEKKKRTGEKEEREKKKEREKKGTEKKRNGKKKGTEKKKEREKKGTEKKKERKKQRKTGENIGKRSCPGSTLLRYHVWVFLHCTAVLSDHVGHPQPYLSGTSVLWVSTTTHLCVDPPRQGGGSTMRQPSGCCSDAALH